MPAHGLDQGRYVQIQPFSPLQPAETTSGNNKQTSAAINGGYVFSTQS
jgi:hypothetical protein